ncbi:WhiB family transcriptional regulator [Mycolicibacterium boenickei]|nr:WhiB family transcriptional regulator [Mycolicibacterium boenickei]
MYEAAENVPDSVRTHSLSATQEQDEWRLRARCRGMNPAVFFHPHGERGHARRRRAEYAKAICAECPVVQMCRTYSLGRNERFGVWGGVSEEERDAILANPRDRNRHRTSNIAAEVGRSRG